MHFVFIYIHGDILQGNRRKFMSINGISFGATTSPITSKKEQLVGKAAFDLLSASLNGGKQLDPKNCTSYIKDYVSSNINLMG